VTHWRNTGVLAALGAAALFGIGTPLAKSLLGETAPWLLAGLLYLGSGLGLFGLRMLKGRRSRVALKPSEAAWLGAAILAGGIAAPVLLMWGLDHMPASGASLLLNAEGVFTALLAWFVFHENFDRRIAVGMLCIVAGVIMLSWPGVASFGQVLPALAVMAACFAWGLDNNLTRKVALSDATFVAMSKGLIAGAVNMILALASGADLPATNVVAAAGLVGFASYGVSLVLFVIALRHLGSARTGAYFSTAPFAGAVFAIAILHEPLSVQLVTAGVLMGFGVWLHLTEQHAHQHTHEPVEHTHEHTHDEHHQHDHAHPAMPGVRHTHWHRHDSITHTHPHFPDAHHRHTH
jgi:drug/metabolite transporter (DMT)-like permease